MEIYAACGPIFSFFSALSTQKSPVWPVFRRLAPPPLPREIFRAKYPSFAAVPSRTAVFPGTLPTVLPGKENPHSAPGKLWKIDIFFQVKAYFTALKSAMVFPQNLFNLLICRFFRPCPRSGRKIPRLTRQYDSLTPCAFSLKLHA